MSLPQFMRRRDGTPVEVIAQGKTFNDSPATVIYLYENTRGSTTIGYAMADGNNPNHHTSSDLLPYNTPRVAQFVQIDLDQKLFSALRTLWKAEQWGPVVDVVHGLDGTLHRSDIHHYLTGLWGA